jgi:2',3'-cyclic-nucleotide 2'-phosphodiesterase (5'-nucleotidase family)
MRTGLTKGNIVFGDLIATTPFENILNLVEIPGITIRESLEYSVSNTSSMRVMQVSGVKVVYNLTREPYDRIVDVKVLCQKCDVPKYEALDNFKIYKVVLAAYVAEGGDGFTMFPKYIKNIEIGSRDVDALAEYVAKISPITLPPTLGRIKFV